jgi:hypothetical protein
MEVLIAVVLITTVIAAILQTKNNSLFFLEKFQTSSFYHSCISLSTDSNASNRNKNIYVSDSVNFGDDDIRKKLKEIKIHVKDEEKIDEKKLPDNDYIKTASINKSTYKIEKNDKTISQTIYSFTLNLDE